MSRRPEYPLFDWWYRDKNKMRERAGRHPGDPMLTPEQVAELPRRCRRITPLAHGYLSCRRREGHAGTHAWTRVTRW